MFAIEWRMHRNFIFRGKRLCELWNFKWDVESWVIIHSEYGSWTSIKELLCIQTWIRRLAILSLQSMTKKKTAQETQNQSNFMPWAENISSTIFNAFAQLIYQFWFLFVENLKINSFQCAFFNGLRFDGPDSPFFIFIAQYAQDYRHIQRSYFSLMLIIFSTSEAHLFCFRLEIVFPIPYFFFTKAKCLYTYLPWQKGSSSYQFFFVYIRNRLSCFYVFLFIYPLLFTLIDDNKIESDKFLIAGVRFGWISNVLQNRMINELDRAWRNISNRIKCLISFFDISSLDI